MVFFVTKEYFVLLCHLKTIKEDLNEHILFPSVMFHICTWLYRVSFYWHQKDYVWHVKGRQAAWLLMDLKAKMKSEGRGNNRWQLHSVYLFQCFK